jgi:hypothetical protein
MAGTTNSIARWLITAALVQVGASPVMAADPLPPRNIAAPTRIPDPVQPAAPAGDPVSTSEMPEVVRRAVIADAATRFKVSPNEVVLTRAERVTWSDGALGCPRPGRNYMQMQVPGFRVVAKTANGELLYHTDKRSSAVNCASLSAVVPRALEKHGKPVDSTTTAPQADPNR